MRQLPLLLTIALLASCTEPDQVVTRIRGSEASAGPITVRAPYALVPFTNSPMPGYLTIVNAGTTPDTLLAVRAEGGFPAPGMHGERMDHIGPLTIGAGETVRLEPGGRHLMFDPPLPEVARGDSIPFTLTFAGAGKVAIQAFVIGYDQVDEVRKPE